MTMFLQGLMALIKAHMLEIVRSKTAIFWMLAFPCGFLLLNGYVMARGDARVAGYMMPGLLTITLMSSGLFGVALPMVQQREIGLLRRLHVTPVSAAAVALSHGVTAVISGTAVLALLMGLATLLFRIEMAGSWVTLFVVFLCGASALIPLGLLVGSTARDVRTAPAIANLLFFPLMFLSGSAFPLAMMPDGIKRFARVLPTTYLVDAYSSVIVRGEGLVAIGGTLLTLLAVGVVGMVLTSSLFRWEGTEPISRKALAAIAVSFAVVLGTAALAAPAFRIDELPGNRVIQAGTAKGVTRILRGATVLDGLGGRIDNARVVIRDQRIVEVTVDDSTRADSTAGDSVVVENLVGRFIIPGLIDSHVHWGGSAGFGDTPEERSDLRMEHDFGAALSAGVTSVVSLTDDMASMRSLAEAVAAAKERAPRTFFSGPSITARGGHPAKMFEFMPGMAEQLTRQVSTEEEAVAAVAELDRGDVDIVKLVLEPGFPGSPMPRLDEKVFRAAVAEAKRRKMLTTVHIGTDADARLAIDAGVDGLEHAARGLTQETLALMASKRITFTPTNVVLDLAWKERAISGGDDLATRLALPSMRKSLLAPEGIFQKNFTTDAMRANMARATAGSVQQTALAVRAGVPILAGSDAGNPATFAGVALIRELELLAEAGMTLRDILIAVTSRPADRLRQSRLGRVASGAVADLVVLDQDPTLDVAAYRTVRSVYLGGRKLDMAKLLTTSPGTWQFGK
ncbi:MAG: amidohydrolase family protein [Cytophagaceae bacterium]|nr:amidohydrolase family protein [Gemmatimonadaceae bacterium]